MKLFRILFAVLALCVAFVPPVALYSQSAAALMPVPKLQFLDTNGVPLAGGKVYTYAAGTTTPLATYTDSSGNTENADPIILDSGGFANIWMGPNPYKIVVQDANGVGQWSQDNVANLQGLLQGPNGSSIVSYLAPWTNSGSRTVQAWLSDRVSVKDFKGSDGQNCQGNGTHDDTSCIQRGITWAAQNGYGLYFPKGQYITSDQLSSSGNLPIRLYGDTRDNSIIYCSGCGAGTNAALQIGTNTANPSVVLEDLSVWGNANTTYAVDIQGALSIYLKSMAIGPASTYCLRIMNWVGGVLDNVATDGNHTNGWPGGVTPGGGVIFTGTSAGAHGNMLTVNGFVGQNINGIAMDFAQTDSIVVNNPQLTNNATNLQIESTATNITITSALFEQFGSNAGAVNVYGIKNVFLNAVWANTPLHIYSGGNNNVFKSCFFQGTVTVDSGAVDNSFEASEESFFNTTFSIADPTTRMSDWHDYTAQEPATNLPLYLRRVTPTNSIGTANQKYAPTIVSGSFISLQTTTPVPIVATPFPITGVAWRAWFYGNWEVNTNAQSTILPTVIEVSDDQPTVALDNSGDSLTFSIDGTSGYFEETASSATNNITFTGTIYLQIAGAAAGTFTAPSLWLTHAAQAPSFFGTTNVNTPLLLLNSATRATCNNGTNGGGLSFNTSDGEPIQFCEGTAQATGTQNWRSPVTYITGSVTASVGSAAGTGATVSLDSDARVDGGLINLNEGTGSGTNALLVELDFPTNQNRNVYCTISAGNSGAASHWGSFVMQSVGNGLKAQIFAGGSALPDSALYQLVYTCH